jgi:hypothetical protein
MTGAMTKNRRVGPSRDISGTQAIDLAGEVDDDGTLVGVTAERA